jgi:hypothetical protein
MTFSESFRLTTGAQFRHRDPIQPWYEYMNRVWHDAGGNLYLEEETKNYEKTVMVES